MALQIEKGEFTRISNEVLEQLNKACLLGSEYQVIFFVIRKTWGWGKTEDRISYTQMETGTGLSRATVAKTLKNLISMNLLVRVSILGTKGNTYKFNKYWKEWVVKTPKLVKWAKPQLVRGGIPKLVRVSIHTKEKKENKRKSNLEKIQKTENIKQQLRDRWGRKGQLNAKL